MTPSEYVGTIMELCQEKRGIFRDMTYIEETRVNIKYELPLNEIIYDFFDQLKSRSRGYASFDYELKEYVKSDLVKLDFLLNGDMCDALSTALFLLPIEEGQALLDQCHAEALWVNPEGNLFYSPGFRDLIRT